jgi:hypothetical protein
MAAPMPNVPGGWLLKPKRRLPLLPPLLPRALLPLPCLQRPPPRLRRPQLPLAIRLTLALRTRRPAIWFGQLMGEPVHFVRISL